MVVAALCIETAYISFEYGFGRIRSIFWSPDLNPTEILWNDIGTKCDFIKSLLLQSIVARNRRRK